MNTTFFLKISKPYRSVKSASSLTVKLVDHFCGSVDERLKGGTRCHAFFRPNNDIKFALFAPTHLANKRSTICAQQQHCGIYALPIMCLWSHGFPCGFAKKMLSCWSVERVGTERKDVFIWMQVASDNGDEIS